MDIRKKFGTSKELETSGVWVDIGDGVRVRVARLGNPNYQRRFQDLLRPYRSMARNGTLSSEIADQLFNKAVAETILLGWEGVRDDGELVPFTQDNALRYVTELPDFRNLVTEIASSMEAFRAQDLEESVKNSEGSSGGT